MLFVDHFLAVANSESQSDVLNTLKFVALRGHAECVRMLVDAGANMEARTEVRVSDTFRRFSSSLLSHLTIFHI